MAAEDEVFTDTDFRFCTVVDRVGPGGPIRLADGRALPGEIIYGGLRIPITPKFQLRGPVAKFIFGQSQQTYVHTVEGEYVNRLAIESGDASLLDELGPETRRCDPIDVDTERVENWDTESYDPTRRASLQARLRVGRVPTRDLSESQAAGGRAFAGNKV